MGRRASVTLGSPFERFTRQIFARIIAGIARTLREHDLSVAQLAVLYLLDERSTLRVGEVAGELARSAPAASRLVDDLVRQGLVARREHDSDRRVRVLTLTVAGQAFVARSSEARVATITAVAGSAPASVLRALVEVARQSR